MAKINRGDRVRLTNPNYPDVNYVGTFKAGSLAGEPQTGVYGTYTLTTDSGSDVRSEGVLTKESGEALTAEQLAAEHTPDKTGVFGIYEAEEVPEEITEADAALRDAIAEDERLADAAEMRERLAIQQDAENERDGYKD